MTAIGADTTHKATPRRRTTPLHCVNSRALDFGALDEPRISHAIDAIDRIRARHACCRDCCAAKSAVHEFAEKTLTTRLLHREIRRYSRRAVHTGWSRDRRILQLMKERKTRVAEVESRWV